MTTVISFEGELGELCLSGRQLTPGYWNDDANNRKAFFMVDGRRWYRTGDVCSLDGDGDILYYGRNDSQVKIQGFRVELGEIEHAARNFFHGERNAVAIAVEDKSGNAIIRLAIEGSAMETRGTGRNSFQAYFRNTCCHMTSCS